MKKKEHKENTKEKEDYIADLISENQDINEIIDGIFSNDEGEQIQNEELPILDEKVLLEAKIAELEAANKEITDRHLRLSAEFDNFRKRTLRERMEMTKTAAESVMLSILPVIDDFERAMYSIEKGMDFEATKEGILLIYNKFKEFNKQN